MNPRPPVPQGCPAAATGDNAGRLSLSTMRVPRGFSAPDWTPDDVIPQGEGRCLRVVNVLESDREDRLPVLVVELAE